MFTTVSPARVVSEPAHRVGTLADLAALARTPLKALAPAAPVTLTLPALTEAERRLWERRLNLELTACGCGTGQFAAVLAIGGYLGAAALGLVPGAASVWGHLGHAFLGALAGAVFGKVVGRVRGATRVRRYVDDIATIVLARGAEHMAFPNAASRGRI